MEKKLVVYVPEDTEVEVKRMTKTEAEERVAEINKLMDSLYAEMNDICRAFRLALIVRSY